MVCVDPGSQRIRKSKVRAVRNYYPGVGRDGGGVEGPERGGGRQLENYERGDSLELSNEFDAGAMPARGELVTRGGVRGLLPGGGLRNFRKGPYSPSFLRTDLETRGVS